MKLCPMRFSGFTWHHNPKELQIINGKTIVDLDIAYDKNVLQNFGEKPIVINGVGELYGDDCLEQYEKLRQLYLKGECGILCLPQLTPIYACFEKLSVLAKDINSVITYSFSFKQVTSKETNKVYIDTFKVSDEKTLWEVAQKTQVDIETLVRLNSDIMFINDLQEGMVINLC